MYGGGVQMKYNWEEIKELYINRGENVSVREFARRHDINYHYLVRKAKEGNWDDDREYHLKTRPLTERQRLFCLYYIQYYNQSKAYRKAYPNCSPKNANVESRKLMNRPEIRHYIESIQEEIEDQLLFDAQAVIRKYIDIAFADIFDIIEVQNNLVKYTEDDDGTIIQAVRPSPTGVDIQMVDRLGALRELAKRFCLDESDFDKELKMKRIEVQQRRMNLQELKEKGDEEALEKLDSILNAIDKEVGGA